MPESYRFAPRPRQAHHLEIGAGSADSMKIEPLSRAFASYCCKSSVRNPAKTAVHPAREANTGRVRLLAPNSHDFLFQIDVRARRPSIGYAGSL
jgi:hypothetical protein